MKKYIFILTLFLLHLSSCYTQKKLEKKARELPNKGEYCPRY